MSKLPILLILIGSDIAMMSRLMEHDRPLFGRVTPMVVPALNPAEVAQALPRRSAMEVFDAYLVTGGYPRLVERCSAARSTSTYVKAALIDPFSDLVISAQLMLDAEFTDAASARRVLTAIGAEAVIRPGFNDVVSAWIHHGSSSRERVGARECPSDLGEYGYRQSFFIQTRGHPRDASFS